MGSLAFIAFSKSVDGLFINADGGFESSAFRSACERHGIILNCPHNKRNAKGLADDYPYFDELIYEHRFMVERTNAWIDACRSFLVRFDTSISSWTAWHYIFAILSWLKQIEKV